MACMTLGKTAPRTRGSKFERWFEQTNSGPVAGTRSSPSTSRPPLAQTLSSNFSPPWVSRSVSDRDPSGRTPAGAEAPALTGKTVQHSGPASQPPGSRTDGFQAGSVRLPRERLGVTTPLRRGPPVASPERPHKVPVDVGGGAPRRAGLCDPHSPMVGHGSLGAFARRKLPGWQRLVTGSWCGRSQGAIRSVAGTPWWIRTTDRRLRRALL